MGIKILNREISSSQKPYLVAEMSANHGGSLQRALDTIAAAKLCGADAIKMQTYEPRSLTIPIKSSDFMISHGPWKGLSLYELYERAHTPFQWHSKLFEHAEKIGIPIFSTPFDEEGIDLLDNIGAPAFKIASFELTDIPFVRAVAKRNKPIIMSTGLGSLEEIGDAVEVVKSNSSAGLLLLHCVSSYPAKVEDSHIQNMVIMKKEFNVDVGLSDHTITNTAAVTAVALGACLIEKHFRLEDDLEGPDSGFSILPDMFETLIHDCHAAWNARGPKFFSRPAIEEENKKFRRSLYFVEDMKSGDFVTSKSIKSIRPGYGLHPKYFDSVVGMKLQSDVKNGDRVSWHLFEQK